MGSDLKRISDALKVPPGTLVGIGLAAFASLLAAVGTRDLAMRLVASVCGVLISVMGIRAAMSPSRPFRLEVFSNSPGIDTTRRVGLFYVAAGLVLVALALAA